MSSPAIKEGMLLRVSAGNLAWLIDVKHVHDLSSMNMVEIAKGQHLTVVGSMFVEAGGNFPKYPVLYKNRLLVLFEPRVNFHVDNKFVKIVEEIKT